MPLLRSSDFAFGAPVTIKIMPLRGYQGRGGEFHQRDVANEMGLAAAKRRREPFLPRYTRLYGRDLDGPRDAR
jgi:hypothetical protein